MKVKYLDNIPYTLVLLVDNNSAEFNLPFLDGKMDYGTTFYGENPEFVKWAKKLFISGTKIKNESLNW
ncbi:MAG: hypothetical protein ACTSYM_11790 [Candidatus Baldrarchaeia archaeon]